MLEIIMHPFILFLTITLYGAIGVVAFMDYRRNKR